MYLSSTQPTSQGQRRVSIVTKEDPVLWLVAHDCHSYLDRLVEDSRRLRSTTGSDSGLAPDGNITPHQYKTAVTPALTPDSEAPLIGPSTEQPPWFQKFNVPHAPILISEACDTAVATRFRQCISSTQYNHPPRLNYPPDDRVVELAESEVVWPSLSKAKMLVNVAIKHVGVEYHIVLRSQVLRGLEQTYQDPESTSSLFKSKLLGLFAIGELYSVRMVNKGEDYPGLSYFAKATRGISIVCERPRLDAIELRLLLVCGQCNSSYLCLFLSNRCRHFIPSPSIVGILHSHMLDPPSVTPF